MAYKNKEDLKKAQRKWYIKNKEKVLQNKDKIKQKEYEKEYYRKNRNKKKIQGKIRREKRRTECLDLMGNKCLRCGFSDKRALQIDHINGGGSKERKILKHGEVFIKKVISSLIKKTNEYQLLCANCNWIKRFENNEL